jgi:hypothetical protein
MGALRVRGSRMIENSMSKPRRMLCAVYVAIAALALVATWRQNLAFGQELGAGPSEMFFLFWPALLVNRATVSITVDLFLLVLAAVFWMVLEARRLQIRRVWLYVVFGMLIAISVTFPLFLAARERRLAVLDAEATEPTPNTSDKLGLGFVTLCTLAFAVWCTLR